MMEWMAPDRALHICRISGPAVVNGRSSVEITGGYGAVPAWCAGILARR